MIRALRQERGVAMVEFALVLPLLLLVIVGIFTFGRYFNYADQQTQMATTAARWAAVNVDPSTTLSLQSYIQAQATGELQAGSGDVTSAAQVYIYYPTGSSNTVGNPVRTCVISTVALVPMLGSGTSVQIVESATMRIEQGATAWSAANNPGAVPSQCPAS